MKTQPPMDQARRQLILNVKWAHDAGATYRLIAEDLGISKSTAARLCKQWTQLLEDTETGKPPAAVNPHDFPGRREYDEAGLDPRFNDIYDREGDEFALLRREAYLIELACAEARKEYLKTGTAPTLAQMLAKMREAETAEHAENTQFNGGENSALHTPHSALKSPALRRSLDGYGRVIYIEKEGVGGKPDIWYNFDKNGKKRRMVRKGYAVLVETLE